MKRRIAAALLVTLLPLGMAACGSQSKADACKEVQGAATKVVEDFSASSAALTDPQALKDQMAKTADTFKEAAKKVSNKEVKDALDPYVESLNKLKDMDPAGALSGDTEYTTAVSDASTKANALASLCGISGGLNN